MPLHYSGTRRTLCPAHRDMYTVLREQSWMIYFLLLTFFREWYLTFKYAYFQSKCYFKICDPQLETEYYCTVRTDTWWVNSSLLHMWTCTNSSSLKKISQFWLHEYTSKCRFFVWFETGNLSINPLIIRTVPIITSDHTFITFLQPELLILYHSTARLTDGSDVQT